LSNLKFNTIKFSLISAKQINKRFCQYTDINLEANAVDFPLLIRKYKLDYCWKERNMLSISKSKKDIPINLVHRKWYWRSSWSKYFRECFYNQKSYVLEIKTSSHFLRGPTWLASNNKCTIIFKGTIQLKVCVITSQNTFLWVKYSWFCK